MRNSQPTTRSDHAPQVGRRPKPDVAPASNRHSRQVPSDREITLTSTAVWHAVLQLPTATEAKPPSCFHTLCALSSHTRLAAEQMWGRIHTLLNTTFASSGARKCLVGWGPSELDLCKSALFAPPSCKPKTWTCGTDPGQAAASILESVRQVRANTRLACLVINRATLADRAIRGRSANRAVLVTVHARRTYPWVKWREDNSSPRFHWGYGEILGWYAY